MKDQLTIALPVYKRTDFVKSALDSAVNQTVKCSILLIDNNSPHDDFKKIVESYPDADIKYIKTDETVPQDENFNNCFRFAETPWVTVLHDDDMLHCQYVEYCEKVFQKFGEDCGGIVFPSFVSEHEWKDLSTTREMTSDIRILHPAYFHFHTLPFPGILVHKDVAMKLGGFKNGLHPIADFDFWFRYTSEVKKMFYVAQQMAFYRISPSQSTNHLIDAMINKIYTYRLDLIKKSKHNNFLARLGLEHSRIHNIEYFQTTYDNLELPERFVNEKKMIRAKRIIRISLINKIIEKYLSMLSFSKAH